jgi:hypothetical protein
MICSNCGKELTEEEIKQNDKIESDPLCKGYARLDYCQNCWWDYAEHAITGD